jgi:putative ATP-binding cassette transporter
LKKPLIAFLDEATSALDEANERLLYERLHTLGLTYVSIGHRSTLKEFHDLLLTLHPNRRADLSRLQPAQGVRLLRSAAVSSWAERALAGETV